MAAADEKEDEVPRLPRGRGLKLDKATLFRIGATLLLLVMILFMRKPCADATSKFVTGFGSDGSGTVAKPGTIDVPSGTGSGSALEYVGPNASEEEVRAAWERAKAKAREEAGSGSGSPPGSASGSGSGSGFGSASATGSGTATGSGSATR